MAEGIILRVGIAIRTTVIWIELQWVDVNLGVAMYIGMGVSKKWPRSIVVSPKVATR